MARMILRSIEWHIEWYLVGRKDPSKCTWIDRTIDRTVHKLIDTLLDWLNDAQIYTLSERMIPRRIDKSRNA